MDWLINRILGFLIENESIERGDSESVEIHKYGLYCVLSDLLDFSALFVFASVFRIIPQTIAYYVAFIGLRRFAGGYHATTRIRCFVISMITWGISMMLIINLEEYRFLTVVVSIVSCVPILLWAPIEHMNNPMTEEKKIRKRKASRIYAIFLMTVVIVLTLAFQTRVPLWMPTAIAYGVLFFAGSLSVAKIQEGTRKRFA